MRLMQTAWYGKIFFPDIATMKDSWQQIHFIKVKKSFSQIEKTQEFDSNTKWIIYGWSLQMANCIGKLFSFAKEIVSLAKQIIQFTWR